MNNASTDDELPSQYIHYDKLGEGTYGCVYKGKDSNQDKIVAIKYIYNDVTNEGIDPLVLREMSIMKSLDHINIIKLFDVLFLKKSNVFVMEYMNASLSDLLKGRRIAPDLMQSYAFQLLCGVHYMHSHRVIHRDLKPSNILLNSEGILKITDFGLSRYFSIPFGRYSPNIVTPGYKAPELLFHNEIYDLSVDIWSVGCIIAEMVVGYPIFAGHTPMDSIRKIFEIIGIPDHQLKNEFHDLENVDINISEYQYIGLSNTLGTSDVALLDLLSKLLNLDFRRRITAKEALNHQYFYTFKKKFGYRFLPEDLNINK